MIGCLLFRHGPSQKARFLVSDAADGSLTHVNQLYTYMDEKSAPKLGVLSEGNWHTVHHLLPEKTQPVLQFPFAMQPAFTIAA